MESTESVPVPTTDELNARAVEMIDTRGKRHLVAWTPEDVCGMNWLSRKFITSRGTFSQNWLYVNITGWTIVYTEK